MHTYTQLCTLFPFEILSSFVFLSVKVCLEFTTCSLSLVCAHKRPNPSGAHIASLSPIPTMAPHLGECRGTGGDNKLDSAVSGEAVG